METYRKFFNLQRTRSVTRQKRVGQYSWLVMAAFIGAFIWLYSDTVNKTSLSSRIAGMQTLATEEGKQMVLSALSFDIPVMIAVSVACLPIFFTGYQIARWEGLLFLAYFVGYTVYLVFDTAQHDALRGFSTVMGLFVLPLTSVTLAVLAIQAWRVQRAR